MLPCRNEDPCGGVGVSYSGWNFSELCGVDLTGCEPLPAGYRNCLAWQINTTDDAEPCEQFLCCSDGSPEAQQQQDICQSQKLECIEADPGQLSCTKKLCPQGMVMLSDGSCSWPPPSPPPTPPAPPAPPAPPPNPPPPPPPPQPSPPPPPPPPPSPPPPLPPPSPPPAPPPPYPPKPPTPHFTGMPPLPPQPPFPPPPPASPPPPHPPPPPPPSPPAPVIVIIDTRPPPPQPATPPPSVLQPPGIVPAAAPPPPPSSSSLPPPAQLLPPPSAPSPDMQGNSPAPTSSPTSSTPPQQQDSYLATQVTLTLTLPVELSSVAPRLQEFVTDLETELSAAANLPRSNVKVISVTAGSVIVKCDILFPATSHSQADAAAFAMNAQLLPAVLTRISFKSNWGLITACTASLFIITTDNLLIPPAQSQPPPPPADKVVSPGPQQQQQQLSGSARGLIAVLIIFLLPPAVLAAVYCCWRCGARRKGVGFWHWLVECVSQWGPVKELLRHSVHQHQSRDEQLRMQDAMLQSEPLGKMPRLVQGSLAEVRQSLCGARNLFSSFGGLRGSLSGQKLSHDKSYKLSTSGHGNSEGERLRSTSRSPIKDPRLRSVSGDRRQQQRPRRRQPSEQQQEFSLPPDELHSQQRGRELRSRSTPPIEVSPRERHIRLSGAENPELRPSSARHGMMAAATSGHQRHQQRWYGRDSARSDPGLEEFQQDFDQVEAVVHESAYSQQQHRHHQHHQHHHQPQQQQQEEEEEDWLRSELHRAQPDLGPLTAGLMAKKQMSFRQAHALEPGWQQPGYGTAEADEEDVEETYRHPGPPSNAAPIATWSSWLSNPQQQQQQHQQQQHAAGAHQHQSTRQARHRDPWDETWWPEEEEGD